MIDFNSALKNSNGIDRGHLFFHNNTIPVNLTTTGNWYKVSNGLEDTSSKMLNFEIISDKLYFRGKDNIFLNNGTADIKSDDDLVTIYFRLFINGVGIEEATTKHVFYRHEQEDTIAIAALVNLNKDDYVEIYASSDTDNVDLTVENLSVTFLGSR